MRFGKIAALAMVAAGLVSFASPASAVISNDTADLRILIIGGDDQLKLIQSAVDDFNKDYPNVHVQIDLDNVPGGWGDFASRVIQQFQANNAYDIYNTAIETFRTFEKSGLFLPLDDHIASNPDYQNFSKALLDASSYEGHVYFVPVGFNNVVMDYNRDLFDKAGVPYPKDDWTWDDFRKTAIALTQKDASGNVTQYGYDVPGGNFTISPWFFTNGTSILNADWTASNMLDPKVSETLQFLHDLIHVDGVSPIPTQEGAFNQFLAGQIAMDSSCRCILPPVKQAGLNMDIAPVPGKVNQNSVVGFGGYAVAKTTKNVELAEALLPYLSNLKTQSGMANGMPGREDAAQAEDILNFPPHADLYWKTLATDQTVIAPGNFEEVEQIFMRYYFAIMSDEMPIADAVKAADSEINDSFARYNAK